MRFLTAVRAVLFCFIFALLSEVVSVAAASDLSPKTAVAVLPSPRFLPQATPEEIPALTAETDKGDVAAQTRLGLWFLQNEDYERGEALLRKAADSGSAEALYFYARTQSSPHGATDEIVARLRKAAEQGYAPAAFALAKMLPYRAGEQSAESAVWLRKAASLGLAQAAQELGMLYFEGRGIAHDGVAAYTWLYLARHGFSQPAQLKKSEGRDDESYTSPLKFLAWTMSLQEVREVEAALAVWPQKPLERPLLKAAWRESGQNRRRDIEPPLSPGDIAAIKSKAASGDNEARVRLGLMHLSGRGARMDGLAAFALFKQAADAGDAKGMHFLAHVYNEGIGTEKNSEKAREIYQNLAEKGDAAAQMKLGALLLQRPYDDKRDDEAKAADAKSAVAWLNKAAEQGNVAAMSALAKHYQEQKDYAQAAFWYERAAATGSESALLARLNLAESKRDAADLYTWISIYMSCQAPAERLRMRQMMLMFASGLTDEQVARLKQRADDWLTQHTTARTAALKRAVEDAEYYEGRDSRGATALHRAVADDNTAEIASLLAARADPNAVDDSGHTPLHEAVRAKNLDAARLLLQAGAVLDAQNDFNETPLMEAVKAGKVEAVRFLLNAGADCGPEKSGGRNFLNTAMEQGSPEIISLLLAAGADPDAADQGGRTPLLAAVTYNKPELLSLLLDAKADPNRADDRGLTPLHEAADSDRDDMLKSLLAAKANPDSADSGKNTPLHSAVKRKKLNAATMLLAAKANPDAQNHYGDTPLCMAVDRSQPDMVKALLAAGARTDIMCRENAETMLYAAVRRDNLDVLRLLLAAKANPDMADKNKQTPLHYAADIGRLDAALLLLQAGADPDGADMHGYTPLILAVQARKNSGELVKALLAAKAKVNVNGGTDKTTALHEAARKSDLETVRLLLSAGADPNAVNKGGKSPLDLTLDPAVEQALEQAGGKSKKTDAAAIYDELGNPMNKAAEEAQKSEKNSGESVNVLLNSLKEAEAFNETLARERAGEKSPYLTRAVLMDATPEQLAERITGGAGVNVVDPVFGTALSQALEQRRNIATVKFLLDNGADPNLEKPLLTALSRPYAQAVPLLLQAGADPETVNYENTPALILAVNRFGGKEAAQALIKAGAPVDAPDKEGRTALYHALSGERRQETAAMLLENGASPTIFPALLVLDWNKKNVGTAVLLLEKGASGTVVRENGGSLLHWAVREKSPELLAAAIKAKAPLNVRARGETALYMAVSSGKADMVAALLKAGAPVNGSTIVPGQKFADSAGNMYAGEDDMLPSAIREGNEEVVKILIAGGVALDARENRYGRLTALHKAVEENLPDIVKILLQAGADPNIPDRRGATPLHSAARKGHLDAVLLLLAARADPSRKDEDGKTPVGVTKNPEIIKALHDAGAGGGT